MKLFVIDSANTQTALFKYLFPTYSSVDTIFRVDGTRDETDGNWYYYSYGKTSAFAGLDWLLTPDTYTGWTTMVVTNLAYPMEKVIPTFKVDGLDVNLLLPFICEYK